MTSRERMLTALGGGMPDRLPVTTHFLMPKFLTDCMGGDIGSRVLRRIRLGSDHVHCAPSPGPDSRRIQ